MSEVNLGPSRRSTKDATLKVQPFIIKFADMLGDVENSMICFLWS